MQRSIQKHRDTGAILVTWIDLYKIEAASRIREEDF